MDFFINLLIDYGYMGMLLAAFLAGSFFPFSSEAVMIGLLAAGLDPTPLCIYATVGNVLGGMFTFGRKQKITDGKGCVLIEKKRQGFDMLPSVRAMLKGDLDTLEKKNLVMEAADFSIRRRDGGQLAMNFDGEMVYGIEQWDARIVKQGLKFVIPKGVTIDE